MHSNGNIADTEQTPDAEHDDHRNCCMTGAAKDSGCPLAIRDLKMHYLKAVMKEMEAMVDGL